MNTETAPGRSYTDCRAGLIIFGIIEILIGAFCALMIPLMVFGMMAGQMAGQDQAMQPLMMVPGMLFYLIIAVWFIWLGIGSVKCRRWARTTLLVTSWMALVFGLAGVAYWFYFAPRIFAAIAEQGNAPAPMMDVMRTVTTVFMFVFYVLGPSALVLFYGNRHVKATCEARDPQTRWTDRCPPQVLALSYMFVLWGVSFLSMFAYKFTVPFFGRVLSGAAGAAVTIPVSVITVWAAWGLYKLKMNAWWTSLTVSLVFFLSTAITFTRVPLMKYYEHMDFQPDQLKLLSAMNMDKDPVVGAFMAIWVVAFLGYVVYTRKYMLKAEPRDGLV